MSKASILRNKQIRLAGIAAVVAIAVIVVLVFPKSHPDRAALRRYAQAITPIVKEGGQVVQEGIKPSLGDVEGGKVTVTEFRDRSAAYRRQMTDVRQRLAAVPHPAVLDHAAALFDRALDGYVRAIDAFVVASVQPRGTKLNAAIASAIPIAEEADRVYDEARNELKKQLTEAGITDQPL